MGTVIENSRHSSGAIEFIVLITGRKTKNWLLIGSRSFLSRANIYNTDN